MTIDSNKNSFTLPQPDERVLVLGSTGSGKTHMGAWLLSLAPFDKMPYVIIDHKRDQLLNSIDNRKEIGFNEIPNLPGLYHLKANPIADDDVLESWLQSVWKRGNIGLYADEALQIPTNRKGSFEGILTQGRALHIPVISLTQRPVDLTRYAFSEANHVVLFDLTDRRDRKKVEEYIPIDERDVTNLEQYHSLWWSRKHKKVWHVNPAPDAEHILGTFEKRLSPGKDKSIKRLLI